MSLSLLTNIAALESESSLGQTQSRLQTTLLQLSTGSRINSGADDAAGLAVVAGLGANQAALTQSAVNAQDGIGLLNVADGALSQVTKLLDRAVTLATEAANGTLNSAQVSSADAEYQAILQEIGNIGATTTVNGQAVFLNTPTSIYVGDGTSSGSAGEGFEVGALGISSIGQDPQTQVVVGPVAPVVSAPAAEIDTTVGVYTLATAASGDTLSGPLSIQVGENGPVTQLSAAAGTTLAQLEVLIDGNGTLAAEGVTATLDGGGNLQITGPSSGGALSFAGTSLVDAQTSAAFVPTATTAVVPGQEAFSYAVETNATDYNDPIVAGGTLSVTLNDETFNYTAPVGATIYSVATDLQTLLEGANISVGFGQLTSGNPGYNSILIYFVTEGSPGYIVLSTTLDDALGSTFVPIQLFPGVLTAPNTVYAFSSDTSVFSGDIAITADGNAPETVATTGLTGSEAADAINNDATLQGYDVGANYDISSHELQIFGDTSGDTIAATGANGTIYEDPVLTSLGTTSIAVTGAAAVAGMVAVTLGSYDDTVSGQLQLILGSSGSPEDALSLTVAPRTTGQRLADQVNADAAFEAAGVSAAYDATNFTVTLTAPAGLTNTLATAGTALIDTDPNPLPGASLAGALSSLTGGNAAALLQAVTSAVQSVAYQRGVLGADVNRLTAESDVAQADTLNLTAASNALQAADYSLATSNLAKYEVLSQTEISALAQANSQAKEVLRLLD